MFIQFVFSIFFQRRLNVLKARFQTLVQRLIKAILSTGIQLVFRLHVASRISALRIIYKFLDILVVLLALMKIRAYQDRKLCNNKFTWCFHKTKQVLRIIFGELGRYLTLSSQNRTNIGSHQLF